MGIDVMHRLTVQVRDTIIPASFAQERLLRSHCNDNPGGAWNINGAARISSALDIPLFEKSAKELVNRHESLRTHFHMLEGEFIQVISERPQLDFTFVELSAHPIEKRIDCARQMLAEMGQKPFNVWSGPLIRFGLCRIAPDDCFFVFVMHHLVSDAWSIQNLGRELDQIYGSFVKGLPSPLPPLPVQFADFAIWERKRLQGKFLDNHIAYWTRQLKGAPLLDLPTDRPRPHRRSYAGASRSITLSRETSSAARELATTEKVTLFTTLFAAFAALLREVSGQEDVVIGTPIGTRVRGTEELIGYFTNTLPLRIDFSSDPCFREILKKVRRATLEALSYQELPLVRLESELYRSSGGAKRPPLFRTVFSMQNVPRAGTFSSELNATAIAVETRVAKQDLMFLVYDWNDSIQCVMEYSTEIFVDLTVGKLLTRFEQLLDFVIRNPESSLRISS